MMSGGIRLPDFDVLVALHQREPEAFEAFRRHMLQQAIDVAPPMHRPALEQLLRRIEEERANAASPFDAATRAMRMMVESVERLHNAWDHAREAVAGLQAAIIIERLRAERRSL
jgi:hypothetical protein